MSPVVRPFDPRDRDSIIALEAEIFRSDAWSPEVCALELQHPFSHYLVLEQGAALVGYGGVRVPAPVGPGDIQTLAVHPDYRRAGWGRRILNELVGHSIEKGVPELLLEVRADNPSAQALYESVGFREIARRPNDYQPDGVDAMVMRLTLSVQRGGTR
ncbi:MAG: ribosomal protein S18-alanine N-acetyltransferase [Pontimonas sp.]